MSEVSNRRFVHFSGTKDEFIDGGYPDQYQESIVFINGDGNESNNTIYTHGEYYGQGVIVEGDASNSAVLKGEYENVSNRALSQTSMAVGAGTTAGLKGWYYSNIEFGDNPVIKLSESQPIAAFGGLSGGSWSLGTPTSIAVGDKVSIVNKSKYDYCGEVKSISVNKITLKSALPFNKLDIGTGITISNLDDWSIYIPDKPDAGIIDFGGGAFSEGGYNTMATNICAHAEGLDTHAYGQYSHAEGRETKAGYAAHAEGRGTTASGNTAHAEGYLTSALANQAHSEGWKTKVDIDARAGHAEGYNTKVGGVEESLTAASVTAPGIYSHAEGNATQAIGYNAHSEGRLTKALGNISHAEGHQTKAEGGVSHAEGLLSYAEGYTSHAEGSGTHAYGSNSHAEGQETYTGANRSHAEGYLTKAMEMASHAEGYNTQALGQASHAGGYKSEVDGNYAFGHGEGIKTCNNNEVSFGKYNNSYNYSSVYTIFSIGDGEDDKNRFNIFEIIKSDNENSEPITNIKGTVTLDKLDFNVETNDYVICTGDRFEVSGDVEMGAGSNTYYVQNTIKVEFDAIGQKIVINFSDNYNSKYTTIYISHDGLEKI